MEVAEWKQGMEAVGLEAGCTDQFLWDIIELRGVCMPTFDEIRDRIGPYINEYGIRKVGVFGSYARQQANESSDIDLLFDFQKTFGLIGLSRLKLCLEESLGKHVDILEFSSIDPLIRDNVLKDTVLIYEQG
jgi:hypothetical protein